MRRLAAALGAAASAFLLFWPSPAAAHRDIVLTVHGDGRGAVWVTAAWADGHPVTEPIGALLIATSTAGERVGPVQLRAVDRSTGTLAYDRSLAAGDWTVVAETGQPAIARCEATVHSADGATPPRPTEVRCDPAAASAPEPAASRALPTLLITAGVIVAVALALVVARSRRARR